MGKDDLEPHGPFKDTSKIDESGLLGRIISLILGANDPEKEKRRLLKQIAKDLKKSRAKFFNPKGDVALPGLAKFFHEIFKVVGPAQTLLQNSETSGALKNIIIEMHLDDEKFKLRESFSEEAIREKLKTMDTKQLAAEIKDSMISFFAAFDQESMKSINTAYNQFALFHALVMYDYFFILKKFDSNLSEKDFTYSPRFESINGEYIIDDIKDFLEVMLRIDKNADWDRLFDILKEYRNVDVVSRPAWKKLISGMEEVKTAGTLELLVKHLEKNPYYKPVLSVPGERIIEPYLNKMKTQTELTIQKILQEKKNQKVDKLVILVFGTAAVARMKNYTEKANMMFSKKMLGGFTNTSAANYLKAFLLDYGKKDIREVRDLLIIRGKWTTNILSQQLSDSFHQVMVISEQLIQFDDACADEGDYGMRLRKFINRTDRDQGAMKALRDTVKEINDKAASLISESAHNLIAFAKNLKALIEDYDKTGHHEILINWKEVDSASDGTVKTRMVEVYKKIYYFVQLLQMFVKSESAS
jgi:hypothetical protein